MMMNNITVIPVSKEICETFSYHNYVLEDRVPSKIDPDAMITVTLGMQCPRCKERLPGLSHGRSQRCPECRLEMTLHGNGLCCTSKEN